MIDGPCARCPQATPKAGLINPSIFCTILAGIQSYPHAYSLDFINDRDAVVHRLVLVLAGCGTWASTLG
jgi:hypothetical protein